MSALGHIKKWGKRAWLIGAVPIFLPLLLVASAIEAAAEEVRHEWRDSLWSIKRRWRGE